VIGQTLRRALVRQFAKPSGLVGHLAVGFADVRLELLPMRPVDAACVLGTRPALGHSATL